MQFHLKNRICSKFSFIMLAALFSKCCYQFVKPWLVDHIFSVCRKKENIAFLWLLFRFSFVIFVCVFVDFLDEALIYYSRSSLKFDMHFESFMTAHHFFSLLNMKSMLHIAKHLLLELWLSNTNPQTPRLFTLADLPLCLQKSRAQVPAAR